MLNKDDLTRLETIATMVKERDDAELQEQLLWLTNKVGDLTKVIGGLQEREYFLRMALKVVL